MGSSTHTASLIVSFQEDLQALLEISPSLAAAFDLDGTILAINTAMADVLGRPGESLVGEDIFNLCQEADQPLMDRVLQVAKSRTILSFDTVFQGRSLDCTLYPTLNAHGSVLRVVLIGMDVTERQRKRDRLQFLTKELERKVLERTDELEAANERLSREKKQAELLADFSRILVEYAHDYEGLMQHITDRITELVGDFCMVGIFSEDRQSMQVAAVSSRDQEEGQRMRSGLLSHFFRVEEIGLAPQLLKNENFVASNLDREKACKLTHPDFWPYIGQGGLKSLVGVPLLVRKKVLGAIFAARASVNPTVYDEDEFAFLHSIASPLALTIENARLFAEIDANHRQLRGLSQQLVTQQEVQYKHLADELHDHIGQDLTAINLSLSLVEGMLPADGDEELRQHIQEATVLVEEAVARMRNIMAGFRPPMLDSYGLRAALFWYGEKFSTQMKIPVTIHDENMQGGRLPLDVELGLFRIAQEALLNAAKHAKADRIDISLKEEGEAFVMIVADDGEGFDPDKLPASREDHWGLPIMHERARAIQASLKIESGPGEGTRVIVKY